jgi:hypothetical protein
METVTSADGTTIVFDRYVGAAAGLVILIGGAFSDRAFPKMMQLAQTLAGHHGLTVINYNRRGRGDSGDTPVPTTWTTRSTTLPRWSRR